MRDEGLELDLSNHHESKNVDIEVNDAEHNNNSVHEVKDQKMTDSVVGEEYVPDYSH